MYVCACIYMHTWYFSFHFKVSPEKITYICLCVYIWHLDIVVDLLYERKGTPKGSQKWDLRLKEWRRNI